MEGTPYNSPVLPDSCAPNFIIYISNGAVQDNTSDTNTATTILQSQASQECISGATTAIPIAPSGSQTNVADEWARFMKRSPYKITTYTVDVDPVTNGQGPGWTALLKSMANVSSGKYFAVSSGSGGAAIANALGIIFAEIQAVNSVFAAVSLPLSVSTQGTYLNQLYVGMFRPDPDAMPRWNGNLKQYKLAVLNDQLTTVDQTGADAINSSTGFITDCARSFWSTADTYWTFRPLGSCSTAGTDVSNSPDGPITEKGAQAQQLRSTTTRAMKTCTAFNCASLVDFTSASVTDAMLGGTAGNKNFQRGIDVNDEDIDGNNSTEMRASVHGDVVHSRPVAVNYGTDAAPEVVVFYAANDGALRAVNGNRSTAIHGVSAGSEFWSFVPFEFHGHVDRLRKNTVPINYQGTTTPGALPKPYGLDGSLAVYENGTTRWLFAAARRGGRTLHAFDVSAMDSNPSATTLKWKIGCPNAANDTGCTTGYSQLGQTWSTPKVIRAEGVIDAGGRKPLLIMGGGYDPCEDADPITPACRDSSKGNRVYVIDANNGTRLLELPTERGVVADVFVVPDSTTPTANIKYAYVVDLGGNVYRIHAKNVVGGVTQVIPIGTTAVANWDITKIASLGCDSAAGDCPADPANEMNRKFLFSVDVLQKPGSDVYNVMVGSGDREKPLRAFDSALDVQNYFFMIKDRPETQDWLTSEKANCDDEPVICFDSLYELPDDDVKGALSADQLEDLAEKKGWYLALLPGEQVVTSAITVFETVTFSTHEPTNPVAGACVADLGTARVYNIDYASGKSSFGTSDCVRCQEISGGGLPPSPVAGKVILDDGTIVPFIIGADPDSPLQTRQPPELPTSTQPKSLTYWFIER
jgi:type IV pilus assembly protein PilY1